MRETLLRHRAAADLAGAVLGGDLDVHGRRSPPSMFPALSAWRTIFSLSAPPIYFMINPNEGLPRYGLSGAYGTIMVGLFADHDDSVLHRPKAKPQVSNHFRKILPARPVELGRWRWSAWALLGSLFHSWRSYCRCWRSSGCRFCPTCKMPSWQALSTIIFRALQRAAFDSGDLACGIEHDSLDGRGADVDRADLRGGFVDRYALEISLAGRLGRRRVSAASGAQLALRSGHRLRGIADFQRRAVVRHDLCHHGGLCRLLDQLRHPGLEQQHDPSCIANWKKRRRSAAFRRSGSSPKVIVPLIKPGWFTPGSGPRFRRIAS